MVPPLGVALPLAAVLGAVDVATLAAEALLTVLGAFLVGWILFRAESLRDLNERKTDALVELRGAKWDLVRLLLAVVKDADWVATMDVAAHERAAKSALAAVRAAKDRYAFMAMADDPGELQRESQRLFKPYLEEYGKLLKRQLQLLRDRQAGAKVDFDALKDDVYRNGSAFDKDLALHYTQHTRYSFLGVLLGLRRRMR